MVASAHSAETQQLWIAGAAALALLVGFAFGTVVPTLVAQFVPESWHWPEEQAAALLRRTPWDAGVRLMQVADPQQARVLADAARLSEDNADVLTRCRKRAEQLSAPVKCSIEIHQRSIKADGAASGPGADWQLSEAEDARADLLRRDHALSGAPLGAILIWTAERPLGSFWPS